MEIDRRWKEMAALTDEIRKEKLSLAWLAAMASVAGFTWQTPETDSDSIDVTLSAKGPAKTEVGRSDEGDYKPNDPRRRSALQP